VSPDTPADCVLRHILAAREGVGRADPFVAGLCGAQGIGKSTLARTVAERLEALGLSVLLLGLDDLYLPRAKRLALAAQAHPLLATRGVPGTHDVALGCAILAAVGQQGTLALPRFDKAQDDCAPPETWPRITTPVDIVLFEGWCVGALPEAADALAEPVNELERREDESGNWRRHVNAQLAGPYRQLFGRIDTLILLAAPGFEVVAAWRQEQEDELRRELAAIGKDSTGTMDAVGIARFVAHYERLTRHILAEMPGRADLVLRLDQQRRLDCDPVTFK
jgi:D-glycerate 3-kinase